MYKRQDLFGGDKKSQIDEIEPNFLKNQTFSNPLKNLYYNYIKKENLNSIESNRNLLKKFKKNVKLIAGDTNEVLKKTDISNVDYIFFIFRISRSCR